LKYKAKLRARTKKQEVKVAKPITVRVR
jgi:hypothetical protein